jgi:hypothetical protein
MSIVSKVGGFLFRIPAFIWKIFVGAFLCQFALTSILAIGWTYRLMQRTALKRWQRIGGAREDFRSYAREHASAQAHAAYPNWFLRQRVVKGTDEDLRNSQGVIASVRTIARVPIASLKKNFVLGIQGIANTLVLTVVPVMLWQFGWYSGWDNSFNMGYEQYAVGMILSWVGIVLFIAVMLYLPMAQARQAVTGEWRAFYQFRLVWSLIRRRSLPCLLLACCYSLLSLPIVILKSFPALMEEGAYGTGESTAIEALALMNSFYFWASMAGFVAYVMLRILAARIYAGAVVQSLREGSIDGSDLANVERTWLNEFGLIPPEERAVHPIVKVHRWTTRPAWRTALAVTTAVVWFSFVAQIYVSEFRIYHPIRGFMNQSLVQLPWFRYVPAHLTEAAAEEERLAVVIKPDDEAR